MNFQGDAYRQAPVRPACTRCRAELVEAPLFSPEGEQLCRFCFHAGAQTAADNRAKETLAGGLVYFGDSAPLEVGTDLEAKLLRSCAKCKAHAVNVVHVTFHYVNGLTRGRTYEHRCAACNATFKTESVLRTITEFSAAFACMLFGACAIAFASGWQWIFVLCLPLGVWVLWTTGTRIVARFKNPVVPRTQLR